jgi:hypothetical protein
MILWPWNRGSKSVWTWQLRAAYATGSCRRKQSLTIFHLSPWAVIMKFCWNGREIFSWNFTNPQTRIRNVNWPPTATSEIKSKFYIQLSLLQIMAQRLCVCCLVWIVLSHNPHLAPTTSLPHHHHTDKFSPTVKHQTYTWQGMLFYYYVAFWHVNSSNKLYFNCFMLTCSSLKFSNWRWFWKLITPLFSTDSIIYQL